jgi:hypothetical protein
MKTLLLIIAAISIGLVHAQTSAWDLRSECNRDYLKPCLLKPEVTNPMNYKPLVNSPWVLKPIETTGRASQVKSDKEKIIKKLMDHLSKIIDLKGKVTIFLEENRETYGSYISLKEQKELLSKRIPLLEDRRNLIVNKFNTDLTRISPELSNRKIRKIIESLQVQRDEDLERIDLDLIPSKQTLNEVERDYFSVLAIWAPYKEHLNHLEDLEDNLMKSLNALRVLDSEIDSPANSSSIATIATFDFSGLANLGSQLATRTGYNDDGSVNIEWLEPLKRNVETRRTNKD